MVESWLVFGLVYSNQAVYMVVVKLRIYMNALDST